MTFSHNYDCWLTQVLIEYVSLFLQPRRYSYSTKSPGIKPSSERHRSKGPGSLTGPLMNHVRNIPLKCRMVQYKQIFILSFCKINSIFIWIHILLVLGNCNCWQQHGFLFLLLFFEIYHIVIHGFVTKDSYFCILKSLKAIVWGIVYSLLKGERNLFDGDGVCGC